MSTYYKILPEDLVCRGFQYHEGLNIDKNTIDEYECSYGLHFSDTKHIFNFCGYGSIIAEVELPEDAIVYHFDDKSKADKIILKNLRPLWSVETIEALMQDVEFKPNELIHEAIRNDYLDVVKYLIEQCTDAHECYYYELCDACENGSLDVVKYLIEQGADIHSRDDFAIRWTSICGRLDIVKYLVEQGADIHASDDYALRIASESGYSDIVKCLVEHGANIHADDDYALRWASDGGYFDIVKYLVEQGANIHASDDVALQWASYKGHLDVVKYLVEHGADIHADNDSAINFTGTPEIKAYLNSLL